MSDFNHEDACVDGGLRGKVLITALTPYALPTDTEADVRGELALHSRWHRLHTEARHAAD